MSIRILDRWAGVMCVAALSLSCETEYVMEVAVRSMSVLPSSAAVAKGGTVAFQAVLVDETGTPVEGAAVNWSTDRPDVLAIDDTGLGSAVDHGVAIVAATHRGLAGTATVSVIPALSIELSPTTVSLVGAVRATRAPSASVEVTNGGGGVLTGLQVTVQHAPGAPAGWLVPALLASTTPTKLALNVDAGGLAAGAYEATVWMRATGESIDPVSIPVHLRLAGWSLTQTEGTTTVREGGTDTIEVVLDLDPLADVRLSAESTDPAGLIAQPSRWTITPNGGMLRRIVILTAVDNLVVDGTRSELLRIAVDAAPGSAYSFVEDRTLEVTVLDNDEADFEIVETGMSTVARERDPPDTLYVALAAGPLSNVVIRLSTDDDTDATLEPSSLTFTPADWSRPRLVLFTAVDDGEKNDVGVRILRFIVDDALSDPGFHGLGRILQGVTLDRKSKRAPPAGR